MPPPEPAAAAAIAARQAIARLGGTMFGRGLTDAAGGNLSVRLASAKAPGWRIAMTPRYAGHLRHWRLDPADVLLLDARGHLVEGAGEPSRDAAVHAAIYRAVSEAGAVVHAHAPACLAFAAARRPIPPRIEAAGVLGTVPVVGGGDDEARAVAAALAAAAARVAAFAAAVLIAGHGVVVAGRDLDHAYDGLERLESNARVLAAAGWLEGALAPAAFAPI